MTKTRSNQKPPHKDRRDTLKPVKKVRDELRGEIEVVEEGLTTVRNDLSGDIETLEERVGTGAALGANSVGSNELSAHGSDDSRRAVGTSHVKNDLIGSQAAAERLIAPEAIPPSRLQKLGAGKVPDLIDHEGNLPYKRIAGTHGNKLDGRQVHKPMFAAAGAAKSISFKDTPYNERKKYNDERATFNAQLSTMTTSGEYSPAAIRNRLNSLFKQVKHLNHFSADNPDMDSFELHTRLNQDNGAFRNELIRREGQEQDFASFFYRNEDGTEMGYSPNQIFPVSSTSASVLDATSISVPRPPGGVAALGDIVVLVVAAGGVNISNPLGWNVLDGVGDSSMTLNTYWRFAEEGFDPVLGNAPDRPSHYNVSFGGSASGAAAVCAVYSKVRQNTTPQGYSVVRPNPSSVIDTTAPGFITLNDLDPNAKDLSLWITAAFQNTDTRLSLNYPDDRFRLREEVLTPEREVEEGEPNPAITLTVADNLYAAPGKFESYTTPQDETIDAYISQRFLLRAAT